jgi:hypothetical protein
MKKVLIGLALSATALFASAAPVAPTATLTGGGIHTNTFAEFTGSTVGSNDMPTGALYWFYEGSSGGYDSYLLMFDPVNVTGKVNATVTFAGNVFATFTNKAGLIASSAYQNAGVTYDWKKLSGLEGKEALTVTGNAISFKWTASSPGDYVRVLTVSAVPEPETYALLLAGLGIMGAAVRRKKKQG